MAAGREDDMSKKKHRNKKKEPPIDMDYELEKATKEMARNKRLVEAGETFRSRRRTGPEKSPSHCRSRF